MRKNLLLILIGSIIIAVIIPLGVNQYYSSKRTEYRNQLEQNLKEKVLEGRESIGAYDFTNESKFCKPIRMYKVSDFIPDATGWLPINRETMWGAQIFNNTDLIKNILTDKVNKWYNLSDLLSFNPFLIIVQKTNRGYDLIGEFILGYVLTEKYPDYLVNEKKYNFDSEIHKKLGFKSKTYEFHEYTVKDNLYNDYINYLLSNKYQNVTIRNEVSKEGNGYNQNIKYNMLDKLAMKAFCLEDSSVCYRVNKYFELKPDTEIASIGTHPILSYTSMYGNAMENLITQTVTMHYSIQENKGLLEQQCKHNSRIFLAITELIYFILCFIFYKRKLF